jgi:GWxTD domain-containing protein
MLKKSTTLAVLLLSAVTAFAQLTKIDPKKLAPPYQEWLKLVTYIIKDKEQDVFLSLASDKERDAFIDAFWKNRDPTPGTPVNEYQDEHIKRFKEANRRFHYGSAREGWMTDRGRFYIILGPPVGPVEDIAGSTELYPCQIWSYYGDVSKGMPTHFSLVFFQRGNAGEYKLYDPVSDGPYRLLINGKDYSPSDYEGMYEKIFELQPDLAKVCLSIIPGEIPYAWTPSPENAILMASITESPRKNISESYATHFLNYRGVVSTEYLTNYIECDTNVAVAFDPVSGMAFCDFAMSPKKLSLEFYEPKSQYYCSFQIDVSLRAGEKTILQYAKEFPLTIPEDRLAETENMGVCIQDSFPVIEGKYKLTVLLRNPSGKEFSTLERDIDVPSFAGRPLLTTPVLAYRSGEAQPGAHLPYQAGSRRMNIDPKATYSAADPIVFSYAAVGLTPDLWQNGLIEISLKGAKPTNTYTKVLSVRLNRDAFHPVMSFVQTIPASECPPDYYDLTLRLKDGSGKVLDERRGNFVQSALKSMRHPISAAKATPVANFFMYSYMLAFQYAQVGDLDRAEALYEKAYGQNPAYKQKVPEYAGHLIKSGKFAEALILIEDIKVDAKLTYEYALTKGRALAGLERYDEAIENLRAGNTIYNSDALLLNTLGTCYYRTGRTAEALAALKASLKLDPNQDDVKKLVQAIEGKK